MNWSSCAPGGVATLSCLPLLIANLIYWALIFAGAVAIIFIIISGLRYMASGGDAKTLDQARKTLTYALIGLILIFLSFLIVETIASVTGVACIKNLFSLGFSACK